MTGVDRETLRYLEECLSISLLGSVTHQQLARGLDEFEDQSLINNRSTFRAFAVQEFFEVQPNPISKSFFVRKSFYQYRRRSKLPIVREGMVGTKT